MCLNLIWVLNTQIDRVGSRHPHSDSNPLPKGLIVDKERKGAIQIPVRPTTRNREREGGPPRGSLGRVNRYIASEQSWHSLFDYQIAFVLVHRRRCRHPNLNPASYPNPNPKPKPNPNPNNPPIGCSLGRFFRPHSSPFFATGDPI